MPEEQNRTARWELLMNRIVAKVELVTISAMQLLLIFAIATATTVLFFLYGRDLIVDARKIASVADLLPAMQQSFAGILIVVLGLELMETLKTYFSEHQVRVEVILVVAIIAIGRHVIQVDFEHTSGVVDMGLASLILALAVGYFLVKRAVVRPKKGAPASNRERFEERFGETAALSSVRKPPAYIDSNRRAPLKIVGKHQSAND
jgi:uncharacterized membrane protein (DUF373 family)